jgi:hypothetical protein
MKELFAAIISTEDFAVITTKYGKQKMQQTSRHGEGGHGFFGGGYQKNPPTQPTPHQPPTNIRLSKALCGDLFMKVCSLSDLMEVCG